MTEIKSAIDHYRDVCVQMGQYPESDTYRYAELAIRSLNAWEEVIEELEEMKCEYDCTTNEFQRGANVGANFIRNKAIDIINQKLAEIEDSKDE